MFFLSAMKLCSNDEAKQFPALPFCIGLIHDLSISRKLGILPNSKLSTAANL